MMTQDKIYEITDNLQKTAGEKLRKAQSYYEGYIQACEDFSRNIRSELLLEENNTDSD